jgi:hypothetical protein
MGDVGITEKDSTSPIILNKVEGSIEIHHEVSTNEHVYESLT